MSDNPSLLSALDDTAAQQPEVMPTAPILKAEFENVNANENGSTNTEKPVKLNKDGSPRKKYTRKGEEGKTAKAAGFVGGVQSPSMVAEVAQRKELAGQCINLVEQSGVMISGEAAKMAEQERLALTLNLDNYLSSKNINDIPPGLLLTIGVGMYYGRVLATPDATTKIPRYVSVVRWVQNKWFAFKGRKNARSDNRDDRQRQDDTGKAAR